MMEIMSLRTKLFWSAIVLTGFLFFSDKVQAITPVGIKPIPNLPFVMTDCYNCDWSKPDLCVTKPNGEKIYGHPEWGPVGSWWDFGDGSCQEGGGTPEEYIRKAKQMKIKLDDGRVIAKPVGIGIKFTKTNIASWATRLNNKPEFDNLAFIVASAPLPANAGCSMVDDDTTTPGTSDRKCHSKCNIGYGEVTSAFCQRAGNTPGCDNLNEICTEDTTRWATEVMLPLSQAFPGIPVFFQGTVASAGPLSQQATTMVNKNIAVKSNGWDINLDNVMKYLNGTLVGGSMGFASLYYPQIIVGFEPRHEENREDSYWAVMEALHHHPDFFDLQANNLTNMTNFKKTYGFPLLSFLRAHTNVTLQNTPDVWTVLRESGIPESCYTGSNGDRVCAGPLKGNFNFWLYQKDNLTGGKTVFFSPLYSNLVGNEVKNHPYGKYTARRTDQATNNSYMFFDIDNGYATAGQKEWQIIATFVNQSTDKISLEYINTSGQLTKKTINKGPALGIINGWVDYQWVVNDADFTNKLAGGADFRINSENDGDEFIHRVIVKRSDELSILLSNWSPKPASPDPQSPPYNVSDKNTDGRVDEIDLTIVLKNLL